MNSLVTAALGFQAIVFLVFIILAFRWLFALRRIAVERAGSTLPGLGATLAAFRKGFFDPQYAALRWGMLGCVLLLSVGSVVSSLFMQGQG